MLVQELVVFEHEGSAQSNPPLLWLGFCELRFLVMKKLVLNKSGIPIFRTSEGNENWFERADSSRNRG